MTNYSAFYCSKCGAVAPEGASFCHKCGAKFQRDSDKQSAKEEELSIFVGRRREYYLPRFKRFSKDGTDHFVPTWNWAALLAGPFWALYRKMYLYGIVGCLFLFMPHVSLLPYVVAALAGNYLYYVHAKHRIADIKAISQTVDVVRMQLDEAGGVNRWMVVVSWLLCLFLIGAIVMAIFVFQISWQKFQDFGTINI